MTYEELLQDIRKSCPDEPMCLNCEALTAVLELHKPWTGLRMNGGGFNGPWCSHCEEVFDGSIRHPCPTVQAIEKTLA